MRQIAISNKKLKGIPRRLQALEKWALSFEDFIRPQTDNKEKYFNWKIPVHSALVQGNQTSIEIQSFCVKQLLNAASYLSNASVNSTGYYRVACLLTWPWLDQSEVTIFYDKEYYEGFLGKQNTLAPQRISETLGLKLPLNFLEHGHDVTQSDDDVPVQWWCLGQKA